MFFDKEEPLKLTVMRDAIFLIIYNQELLIVDGGGILKPSRMF